MKTAFARAFMEKAALLPALAPIAKGLAGSLVSGFATSALSRGATALKPPPPPKALQRPDPVSGINSR